jgi:hypothetical protein
MFHQIFPSKSEPNPNLQRRITRLFERGPKMLKVADNSPTLQVLQKQKNKVRRISSVYEENIAAYNDNMGLRRSTDKKPFTAKFSSVPNRREPAIKPIINTRPSFAIMGLTAGRSIEEAIQHLIESDAEYMGSMKRLIKEYVKSFENLPALRLKNETKMLEQQKREIFGPIENILDLHEKKFHPMLLSCSKNIVWLSKNLSKLCDDGKFNPYLVYAMDEKVS